MDDVKKILQLVADNVLSPADALVIFDRWKAEGKQVLLDPSALDLISKEESVESKEIEASQTPATPLANKLHNILSSEILTLVGKILKKEPNEISLKTPIKNYGLDSVSASEITMHFKDKYQIPLTPPMLFEIRNLGEYIDQLISQFYDKIADYHHEEKFSVSSSHDTPVSPPGIAAEDDQNITYIKDEALFEGKRDFDSMWIALEKDELEGEKITPVKTPSESVKGNSLTISIGTEILEFISFGKGDPILLIGGLGTDQSIWQFLLPGLIEGHKAIIFYPPGHGKSTLAKSINRMSDIATLLKTALEQLNITAPIPFIGYSSGAAIALEFALQFPDQIKSLVLISATPKSSHEKDAYQKATREFKKIEHLIKNTSQLLPFNKPTVIEYYKPLFQKFNVIGQLKNIRCTTLIICGNDDEYISPENSKILNQEIKGSKIISIEHAGHFALLTHAENILEILKT